MYITHLSLTNFRNYTELEFDIPQNISIFQGDNAQGKTNLLESICFLATTRFSKSIPDREAVNWNALNEKIPLTKLSADIQKTNSTTQLEIIIRPRTLASPETNTILHKNIRINGTMKRAVDLMGQLNMVIFSPRDIDLISEEPSLRRRYLDITNSQIDQQYLRALQRYSKVLSQRNHLLRQIAIGHSRPDELAFWNDEMVRNGTYIIAQRKETITRLSELSIPIHQQLSGGQEDLTLKYLNNVSGDSAGGTIDIETAFYDALNDSQGKELARGQSLIGPHRDDIQFMVNEVNIGHYGSRGQQRTVALSLKLAESEFMLKQTSETPVLLLDDVLSELDKQRRQHLLEAVSKYQQVLITTTDLDRFPPEFLGHAQKFEVRNGKIHPND